MENIFRKGEIVCNKQFFLFLQCFLHYTALIFHFKCTLKCCLRFVSIWTSLKFCSLVIGLTSNFSFSHSVFKRFVSQGRQKVSLCGNWLIKVERCYGRMINIFLPHTNKHIFLADCVRQMPGHLDKAGYGFSSLFVGNPCSSAKYKLFTFL